MAPQPALSVDGVVKSFGVVQAVNAPLSMLHANVDPVSSEAMPKLGAAVLLRLSGALVIDVCGAVVSTVHVYGAGEASVFPAWSVARTWNVWLPSLRLV